MEDNYTSLKSSIDEEDELKTGHEIDLEKGPLPEHNSEGESTLPPYSDISKLANLVPEDSITGPTETANPNVERRQEFKDLHPNIYFLLRLLIAVLAVSVVFFTAWGCVNPLEKSTFGKIAFFVLIGLTCLILLITMILEPGLIGINIMKRLIGDNDCDARQHANSDTAIPLREMNPESEA
ncbi:Wtf35 [Schizosaccharomyces pombe]|uniref:Cw12 n=1 Tax=Schizosaccharomyces pombe TaxID=4896 RepID=A0A1X9Q9F6_SCHPM|nr:cw12 [Schizosaccharomyces pombe]